MEAVTHYSDTLCVHHVHVSNLHVCTEQLLITYPLIIAINLVSEKDNHHVCSHLVLIGCFCRNSW